LRGRETYVVFLPFSPLKSFAFDANTTLCISNIFPLAYKYYYHYYYFLFSFLKALVFLFDMLRQLLPKQRKIVCVIRQARCVGGTFIYTCMFLSTFTGM
jgi:hypothetical protein